MGQSRVEDILEATIDAEPYTEEPQSRVEELLIELKETIEDNPGGASDLVDLDDVNISQVNDGQVLKYNSQTSKWENKSDEGGTVVEANPQDQATTDLTKLKVANTIYGIPQGTAVEANPSGEGTADLTKLRVGNTIYDIPEGGTDVEANPTGTATDELDSIRIGNDIFSISSGGGGGGKRDIFSNIDSLIRSSRYAEGSLSGGFSFNMSEYVDDWSTSATVFNSTGIDLTDYDELEFTVNITDQSDYGAFWLTISGTKYTWNDWEFPTMYVNLDSLIKVTESGTYTVDVSELIGEYYIYLGGTTGKPAVAHGDCSNNYNGSIAGTLTSLFGVIKGSGGGIIPNPEGEPTDTLNTIEIDGVIYDLPSGSGSASDIVKIYDSGSDTVPAPTNTEITYINNVDISDYDLIMATYSLDRGSVGYPQTSYATALIDDVLNDSVNNWVVTGYANRWASLRINPTSFIVPATGGDRYGIYKLFAIKLGSGSGGGTSAESMSLHDYGNLTPAQKVDGTIRFIPHSDVSEQEAIDMTTQGFYENPGNMNVTDTTSTKTTVTWGGGVQIGCSYYYTTPVDVTDWESIMLDIHTGSCYGGGSTAQQPGWDFIVGLLDYEITSAVNLPASSSDWKVVADLANSNYDYSNTILDTSDLTGELYLTVVCHGWNATVENIRLVNAGGNASQIKYMGETYALCNPSVSFLYWATGFDSTITLEEDIRNFDRIMIFTNGGKPFTCDPADYFNGVEEYFGVGMASNKYVWYNVGSDGKTLTSAYHDSLEITLIIGITGMDTDCPWTASHDH